MGQTIKYWNNDCSSFLSFCVANFVLFKISPGENKGDSLDNVLFWFLNAQFGTEIPLCANSVYVGCPF